MATIVEKFFRIIKPTKAFFGQKDLQQLQIVKALVKQMKIAIEIISVPIIREKNGLAKSSRNKLLSFSDKENASLIYRCLFYCKNNKTKRTQCSHIHGFFKLTQKSSEMSLLERENS